MRPYLPFALLLVVLSSCAGGWQQEDKQTYLQQCHSEAAGMYASSAQTDKYCQCNLDAVMKHYGTMEEVLDNKDSAAVRKELEQCSQAAQQ